MLLTCISEHPYTIVFFIHSNFSNQTLDVDIPWYNPVSYYYLSINMPVQYRGLTMLHYNPIDGRLYFFDAGKLLSVNVRIEDTEGGGDQH